MPKVKKKAVVDLNRSIDELDMSVRCSHCLKKANIQTIGELIQKNEQEMLRIKQFGRKSLIEMREILFSMGLSLGMRFDERGNLLPAAPGTPEAFYSETKQRRAI